MHFYVQTVVPTSTFSSYYLKCGKEELPYYEMISPYRQLTCGVSVVCPAGYTVQVRSTIKKLTLTYVVSFAPFNSRVLSTSCVSGLAPGWGLQWGAKPGGSRPLGLERSRELKTDIIQITTQTNV